MTHLDVENLVSEYLEGRLEAARRVQVESHLAACPSCRETVEEVRRVLELCRISEDLEPAPWLVTKIMRATVGERPPTLSERITAFLQPVLQARVGYSVAMALFSFSIIINAAGINLRHLTLEDLNPRTWMRRADRSGHLLYARTEKFLYDLRVVYEIESRLRQLRPPAPAAPAEEEKPKPEAPPGGTTDGSPGESQELAALPGARKHIPWLIEAGFKLTPATRSTTR